MRIQRRCQQPAWAVMKRLIAFELEDAIVLAKQKICRYHVGMIRHIPIDIAPVMAEVAAVFEAERKKTEQQIVKARKAIRRSIELLNRFQVMAADQCLSRISDPKLPQIT
jgi:hypothetical protein